MQRQMSANHQIALVGMACRFPGAQDIDTYWHNLINGVESLASLDKRPEEAGYIPVAAPLAQDIARFDAGFFGLSARDAALMDPQQRLFLECAWHALESAGITPGKLTDTALFAGCSSSEYLRQCASEARFRDLAPSAFEQQITNDKDYLSSRIAWHLGLEGQAVNVQAACATSLVAVAEAVYALRSGRCRLALAGACTLRFPQDRGYVSQQGMVFSTDGHCRPFSAEASGTVFGSGVGVVVMKRLEDALAEGDEVIAVIEGVAVNNDGADKVSFTTTSLSGQQRLLREALTDAAMKPTSLRAIETHGTGTLAGDPIEFSALESVFREYTDKTQFCTLGAVKANVGHLETAAGMAGFIKAALQIKYGWLTPQINVETLNPTVGWQGSPFEIIKTAEPWPEEDARRAIGVSAFGIGGTNAHVILSRPAKGENAKTAATQHSLFSRVIPVSARSESALYRLLGHYKKMPVGHRGDSLAWSAQTGRMPMRYRCTLTPGSDGTLEIHDTITDIGRGRLNVVFQFPGQGSQFIGMARELMNDDPVFNQLLQHKIAALREHVQLDITAMFDSAGDADLLNNTALTQPTLVAVEIALAELLMHYGVIPDTVIGHSVGEIAAAWAAGAFDSEQAVIFAARRGALMAGLESGRMLAVELSEAECQCWLSGDVALAAVNSDNSCVLSGSHTAIADCEQRIRRAGIRCKGLPVSHAFHSSMMEPVLASLRDCVPEIISSDRVQPVRFISALRAQEISDLHQLDADYWSKHARNAVRYHQALQQVPERGKTLFIEVGPGSTLTSLVTQLRQSHAKTTTVRTLRRRDDVQSEGALWVQALQKIWRAGVDILWARLWDQPGQRIALPLYPFDPEYWWMGDRILPKPSSTKTEPPSTSKLGPLAVRINQIWLDITGAAALSMHQDFYDAGGHSLMALRLLAVLEKQFGVAVSMTDFLQQPTPSGIQRCLQNAGVVEQNLTH